MFPTAGEGAAVCEWQLGPVLVCSRSFEVMLAAPLGSSVIRLKEAGRDSASLAAV